MLNLGDVIEIIESAFENVTLDNGISIREAKAIDSHSGIEIIRKEREKDERDNWSKIPYENIIKYPSVFAFMDEKGLLFHLPAYMIFTLTQKNSKAIGFAEEDILYTLIPEESSGNEPAIINLNKKQVKAIQVYLEWKLKVCDIKIAAEDYSKALRYWKYA
ncbi:MAG: DUF6714 family protein [Candidatus Thiodiazotropha sp. LLP2]